MWLLICMSHNVRHCFCIARVVLCCAVHKNNVKVTRREGRIGRREVGKNWEEGGRK